MTQSLSSPLKKGLQTAYPFVVRPLPLSVEHSDVTFWTMLEVTSKCDLRCVYCGKSSDPLENRRAADLPEKDISETLSLLRKRGLRHICMSGIGETTTRKGWNNICNKTFNTGIAHTIITNLAHPISDEEAETLARFNSVQVSVDTANPDLFSKIRRGAKLPVVLANINRIRDAARQIGTSVELKFDMVVCDKTVHGLEETVELGLRYGVTSFYFAGLFKLNDVPGPVNVYHVKSLPKSELRRALQSLERAIKLAQEASSEVQIHQGLIESIKTALVEYGTVDGETSGNEQNAVWDAPAIQQGFTRDCLDPWSYVFLYAHGEVRPCCAYQEGIGNIRDNTLSEILNGPTVKQMRRNLLSGELDGMMCKHCSMRDPIKVEDFRLKVKALRLMSLCYRFLGRKFINWLVWG